MRQLPLLFEQRRLFGREDFFISHCNIEVVEWIDAYPDWNNNYAIVVYGAKSSGKTHASFLFSEKTNAQIYNAVDVSKNLFSDIVPINSALVIENIDEIIGNNDTEENLFHILNYSQECNTKLFLTISKKFSELNFQLPDLKTRLNSLPIANIYSPDDEFLQVLLIKQFMEKNIIIVPEVIDYIIKHIPRNAGAVKILIDKADELSIENQKKITIPFIKKIIETIPE